MAFLKRSEMEVNKRVFQHFPVLHTERLTLRDIRLSDAPQILAMRASHRVNHFIARPPMTDLAQTRDLIEKTIKAYENQAAIGWAGILREREAIIGTCGFNQIDYANLRAEIGGELAVDYWGKNIALEAVQAIVRFGLEEMNLHTIEAKVSPGNRGAVFLLEHLGFRKEAHFRDRIYFEGTFSDMAVYTLLRGEENLEASQV